MLGKLNTTLTGLVAIVASLAAIFSYINKGRIEKANVKIAELDTSLKSLDISLKKLDVTEKQAKARSEYADIFLHNVLPDPALKESAKHVQALLSILNITAQTSETGNDGSEMRARAIMPLQLALLLGQPGGVAAMDVDYKYFDDWVAMALADDSHSTRVTAIQALTGVCQKALRQKRLEVLSRGVEAVNEMLALIREDQATVRAPAVAARSQLASFITKQHQLLDAAQLPDGDRRTAENVKSEVRAALGEAQAVAQATKSTLQATYAKLEDSTKPADVQQAAIVKNNLGQIDAALKTAAQVTVEREQVPVSSDS